MGQRSELRAEPEVAGEARLPIREGYVLLRLCRDPCNGRSTAALPGQIGEGDRREVTDDAQLHANERLKPSADSRTQTSSRTDSAATSSSMRSSIRSAASISEQRSQTCLPTTLRWRRFENSVQRGRLVVGVHRELVVADRAEASIRGRPGAMPEPPQSRGHRGVDVMIANEPHLTRRRVARPRRPRR